MSFCTIHTGDLHIGGTRYAFDYLNRTKYHLNCLKNIITKVCKKYDDVVLMIAGDFFDTSSLKESERSLGYFFLFYVSTKFDNLTVILMNGNHDFQSNSGVTMVTAINSIVQGSNGKITNLKVVDTEPETVITKCANYVCIPCAQSDSYMKSLHIEDVGNNNPTYVVSHECIVGAKLYSGVEATKGISFESLQSVYCGKVNGYMLADIHKRQRIPNRSRIPAWYCGSPWQIKFDEDVDKGVLIWDSGKHEPDVVQFKSKYALVETNNSDDLEDLSNTKYTVRYTGLDVPKVKSLNITHVPKIFDEEAEDSSEVDTEHNIEEIRSVTNHDLTNGLEEFLVSRSLSSDEVKLGVSMVNEYLYK